MINALKFAIVKWLLRRAARKFSKQAILSCGFQLYKSTYYCTICKEWIRIIVAKQKDFITHSGEIFLKKEKIGSCCLRCRWFHPGEPYDCDDRQHGPLINFLNKHGYSNISTPLLDFHAYRGHNVSTYEPFGNQSFCKSTASKKITQHSTG